MPQGGQGLVLGGAVAGELVDEAAGQARGDPGELEGLQLAPGEEAAHHAGVGAAGVGIGDAGGEELISGKQGLRAGALQDGRDRPVQIEGPGGGYKSGLCGRSIHGESMNDNSLYRPFSSQGCLWAKIIAFWYSLGSVWGVGLAIYTWWVTARERTDLGH